MKKYLIGAMCLLLIGCQSGDLEAVELEKSNLLNEVETLKTEKSELMDQIKTLSEEKMTFYDENVLLKSQLESCEEEKKASLVEKEAIEKSLEAVATNPYEAQFNFDVNIVQTFDGKMRYVFEPAEIPHAQYYIVVGENPELNNIHEDDAEIIEFGEDAYEVVSFQVEGTIYNFKWSNIEWNSDASDYEVTDLIEAVNEVKDRRVNIRTMLPEGLPHQLVQWENSKGEVFEVVLHYDGIGFEGEMIICE